MLIFTTLVGATIIQPPSTLLGNSLHKRSLEQDWISTAFKTPTHENFAPQVWIIHLDPQASVDDFHNETKGLNIQYSERFRYDSLFHGISIQVHEGYGKELSMAIKQINGVKSVKTMYPTVNSDSKLAFTLASIGSGQGRSTVQFNRISISCIV